MVRIINDGFHSELDYSEVGIDKLYNMFFHLRVLYSYGDVTIAVEGLQIQTKLCASAQCIGK